MMLMTPVTEYVTNYLTREKPNGVIVELEQCLELALSAVRCYAAYGKLSIHKQQMEEYEEARIQDPGVQRPKLVPIDQDLPVTLSEWGVMRPLWLLYVERDRAELLEATKMMGDVSFGRTSSEVAVDITNYEESMPLKAFSYDIFTI